MVAVRVPLKQYRFHLRGAYLEVDRLSVAILLPTYFGSTLWMIPTAQVVAADLTAVAKETGGASSEDVTVLEAPPVVPYFFTTSYLATPTTVLLFRSPQRVPVLRRFVANVSNTDLGFTRRQSRSEKGALVDGILVRVDNPPEVVDQLRAVGIETVVDPARWLGANRPTIKDAVRRDARLALENRLLPKHGYLLWVIVVALILVRVAFAVNNRALAITASIVAVASFVGRFAIRRRLKQPSLDG